MLKPKKLVAIAVKLLNQGEYDCGVCCACGNVQEGVEPDATGYTCEECGEDEVAGAEQVLLENASW